MKAKGTSQTSSSTANMQGKLPPGGVGGGGHTGGSARGTESKATPTAEQIRYAKLSQMSGQEDHAIQEKIKEVAQITGKSLDTAAMALHDSNYDTSTAIQKLIDGDYDIWIEWTTTASKKKKPLMLTTGPKTPNEPTPDTGITAKDAVEEGDQKASIRFPSRGSRGARRGRSRKPDEKEEKAAEGGEDVERDKERSLSERGHGRGKMQGRIPSRGRGRSAGYGGKSGVGRGASRSRGRQPRRGRGRSSYAASDHDGSSQKFEPESSVQDSGMQEDWDDEQEEAQPTHQIWVGLDEISAEQAKPSKEDWGSEGEPRASSIFSASRNPADHTADGWKHANGPQSNWLDAKADLKTEDASYLPENVDGAVILSKRAPHATTSEPTSYHSTSELSRSTYSSFQNNQFPSSNPEMSLTSGFSKQVYHMETLLNQPTSSSDKKEPSSVPVISGIQDSRKLEQEQLHGPKAQRAQKSKRSLKSQPPCQPVEMPRSMMYELDSQLSGLQFGSSPLSANAPQEVGHSVTTSSTASVLMSSSASSPVTSVSQGSVAQSPVSTVSQKSRAGAQFKSMENFPTRTAELPSSDIQTERSDLSRTNAHGSDAVQYELRSGFIKADDSRKEVSIAEYSRSSSSKPDSPRYNGVVDTLVDSNLKQGIDSDAIPLPVVSDIRRQTENKRVGMHQEASKAAAISTLPKSISQRGEIPTERLGLTSDVGRTSYMPEVSRHRKTQEAPKTYSSPEAVRGVLSEQLRYDSGAEVRKQSPPLSRHETIRQALRSEPSKSTTLPDMRHNLVQSTTRRSMPQEPARHDVVSEVSVSAVQPSLPKSDKPKTPPGLSSLQERGGPVVYSGSSASRDVSRLVTSNLSMVTSTLSNTFGGVSRGASIAYVQSAVPAATDVQTSSVMATLSQSAVMTGTSTLSSNALTTIVYTTGTSTQSGLKSQTTSSKSSGPPGMLPLGMIHNVQQGLLTPYPHQAIPYHFDDLQMMQRMPMSPYYPEVMYPPTAGSGREAGPNPHTFQGNEGKYVRDNSSPVASSISQGTPHAPHPQPTMFASTHPPPMFGYTHAYYQHGVLPQAFPVFTTAQVFPMTGSKVVNNQYQSGYGAQPGHGFSSVGNQEFSKTSYHSSVGQTNPHKTNQGAASLTSGTSATDSAHHSTGFKVHETKSFVNGTPPPTLGIHVAHGQNHPGNYQPQYVMQHAASMLHTQPVAHHQMDSSSQSIHSARGQQHLGIGGAQSSKGKSQSLWGV